MHPAWHQQQPGKPSAADGTTYELYAVVVHRGHLQVGAPAAVVMSVQACTTRNCACVCWACPYADQPAVDLHSRLQVRN